MDAKAIAIGGSIVAVVVLIVLYQARKDAIAIGSAVVDAATSAAQAVNPLNEQNVFASTVNATGAALTGDAQFSLGSWLYDITHPAPLSATAP